MKAKIYQFTEKGQKFEFTMSQLVNHFGGYLYDENGKRITPKKAKLVIRVNRQGGEIIL